MTDAESRKRFDRLVAFIQERLMANGIAAAEEEIRAVLLFELMFLHQERGTALPRRQ